MHIVIMGCGRVGATLAKTLVASGRSVAVIDHAPRAFRRLPANFTGRTVTGTGFDPETLRSAGIEEADAFAAVSNGDNSNIIAARVVREEFDVTRVVARIYDPARAELYERLGIPTVATVRWTADQVLRRLLPAEASQEYVEPGGRLALVRSATHCSWVGTRLSDIESRTGCRTAFLDRGGHAEMGRPDTLVQDGDELVLVAPVDRSSEVRQLLVTPKES